MKTQSKHSAAGWPLLTAAELQAKGWLLVEDGNHGEYRPRPSEFGTGETAFIRAADMSHGEVLFGQAQRISEVARARIRKGVGQPGDVIFSHKGTVGKLAIVSLAAPPFVCSPQTTFWRTLDDGCIDRRFLYYFMSSREFADQWQARKGETDMADYVSLTVQRDFEVAIPPIEQQRAIGQILGALDDKIELNRQMDRTLEAMAQALFKSWFVDFDPVVAKAAGRQPFGIDAEAAALFPGRFVDSALGHLPDGWQVGTLSDCLTMHRGVVSPQDQPTTEFDHYSIPAFDSGQVPVRTLGKNIRSAKSLLVGDCILVSKLNPHIPRMWLVSPGSVRPAVASTEFLVCQPRQPFINEFLYGLLRSPAFQIEFAGLVTGTSNSHQRVQPEELLRFKWIKAPEAVVTAYARTVGPLLAQVAKNLREMETLGELRDGLLPKLLSGEVRVKHAEDAAAEALA